MKLLVIGSQSFVGSAVVRLAIAGGHDVVGFCRKGPAGQTTIQGTLESLTSQAATLRAWKPDAVIHAIAYTEQHAHDLVTVFAGESTRVIVLSSVDCYEAFQQQQRGLEVADSPLDETSPTWAERHYARGSTRQLYAEHYDKNLVTDAVLAAHRQGQIQGAVLRLPSVYGPNDRRVQVHAKILRRIYDKQKELLFGTGEQSLLMTVGYIENIAAAILHAASSSSVLGEIFNIGDTQVRSMRRWAELFAKAAGHSFDVRILADAMVFKYEGLLHAPPRHIIVDCQKFARTTGYRDPVGLEEAVARTLAWGLANPETLGPKPDYKAEREMINAYERFVGMWLVD